MANDKKRKSLPLQAQKSKKKKPQDEAKPPILDNVEPDFPRGGAPTLTREEIQEARAQAEAEFKSEGRGCKKVKKNGHLLDENRVFLGKVPKFVELLRYKNLSLGMKIWGVILEVGVKDIVVSLPGGLRGFVRAEDASDYLSESFKSHTIGGEGAIKENGFTEEEKNSFSLKEVFSERQLVSCIVTELNETKNKENKKKSKRIGLSLKLSSLHKGLTIDAMHEGSLILAYVTSIEDHGYLLSFAVPGITGFLLHTAQGAGESTPKLRKGQLLQCLISSIDKKRGMVVLKADSDLVASTVTKDIEGLSMELLVPGTLVNARVRAVLKNGLLLSFLTYFSGTVNVFHLEDPLPDSKWHERYTENLHVKARILYVDHVTKSIGLTLNANLVQNTCPTIDTRIGEVYENAIVQRLDPTIGLLLELPSQKSSVAGYVHISDASDERIEKLQQRFKEGRVVKGRVVGMRLMDGLAVVTLKESKVKKQLLGYGDLQPGMTIQGEIISVENFGAFVKLSDGIRALCPLQHMSEFQRIKPSPKFQAGKKMKFKVLSCDVDTKKITLSHKKTLLQSKLRQVVAYEDAVEGLVTHGWISGVEEYGCFVCFYNNVKGLAHRTELGLDPGVKPDSVFQIGQVVKCRVLRADPAAQRLSLSFILSPNRFSLLNPLVNLKNQVVLVGMEVSGLVAQITDNAIILDVSLATGVVKALIKFEHLSDTPGHAEQLKSLLSPGYKFERLLVLEHDEQKLIVTAKFSLMSAKSLPSDIAQLSVHQVVQGYVANITDAGCFVRFLGGLTGLATISQVSDGFVYDASEHFSLGQSVRAQVLEVNLASARFTVCLKQSKCFSTDVTLLQGYFLEEEQIAELQAKKAQNLDLQWARSFKVGACVEGEIDDIKDYGVIISFSNHKDVVGFVTTHQLSMEVVVGQHVTARVLDVVKSDGIVDLTLRPELVYSKKASSTVPKKASHKRSIAGLKIQQTASAVIELIKDEYLVLSLPEHDNAIAFAAAHDYNLRVDPHKKYTLAQRVDVTVGALPDSSGRLLVLLTSFSDPTSKRMPKRLKSLSKYEADSIIKGEVVSVQPMEIRVKFGKGLLGRVHITEAEDDCAGENPLDKYMVGQSITAKVLGKLKSTDDGKKTLLFDLTLKPSELQGSESVHAVLKSSRVSTFAALHVGQIVMAYVKEILNDWAWLTLSPSIKGRLFVLDSSDDPVQLQNFTNHFQIGQGVKCRVMKIDHVKGALDLSLRGLETSSSSASVEQRDDGIDMKKGDIVGGRVSKVLPGSGGLKVQLGPRLFGRVHITDLSDAWRDRPTEAFQEGQFVQCFVLDAVKSPTGTFEIDLSLRSSVLQSQINGKLSQNSNLTRSDSVSALEKLEDLRVGMEVQGFVKNVTKKGCFITLSRHIDARVLLSNLSDTFIEDPAGCFPPGKLVKGRVVDLDPNAGRVDVSLKISTMEGIKDSKSLLLNDMNTGDFIAGVVRRVESFGLFIAIDNSAIVGLCHISEISDNYIKNLEAHYKAGDKVRAKVLKIDDEKNRVYLGMKEAYFKGVEIPDHGSNQDTSEVSEEGAGTHPHIFEAEDLVGSIQERTVGESILQFEEECVPQYGTIDMLAPPLDVVLDSDDGLGEDNDVKKEDISAHSTGEISNKPNKRAKKRLKEDREAAIRAAEKKRLEGSEAPENAEDFEKLVHASPNSSFIWIKYMAFMLSLGDVDKARNIAERALQTIHFREEGEKLNVWVAFLNLENVYGSPTKEATLQVFQRALQYCDPKKLYLALLGIYERSEQHDLADELLKTMIQKFKSSSKVWLRRIVYLLKRGMPDAAHKALDRALLSLPRHKHIKFISQAAISEFKIGSAERARGMFEGILRNYPKRTDLWSVYLDQEMAIGDPTVIRALFERATCLELPPKKMKFLFKKYLEYEKSQGDVQRIEYVKGKAMQYVETKIG